MRFTAALALALTTVPGIVAQPAAQAAVPAGSTPVTPAAATSVTVARYTFDRGAGATGRIAENSGRGAALTIRTAGGGRVAFPGSTDKYAAFPAVCRGANCARALLEGTDDPDLDPGTRTFRWGASVHLGKAQISGSSNVMQKGVVDTESQWKLQIGARKGNAQCVVVGQGSAKAYVVRSSVGVADSKWHTVLCLRSASKLSVYVDGRERGHLAIPATVSIANSLPLRIGGPNFAAGSDMYHGRLDDVFARLG